MSELTVAGWRVYYADGTVADSRRRSWEDAPSTGVQVVVVFHEATYPIYHDGVLCRENYRTLLFGKDYYWKTGETCLCGDAAECEGLRPSGVKRGAYVPDADWMTIYNRAHDDVVW